MNKVTNLIKFAKDNERIWIQLNEEFFDINILCAVYISSKVRFCSESLFQSTIRISTHGFISSYNKAVHFSWGTNVFMQSQEVTTFERAKRLCSHWITMNKAIEKYN
ncbi:hypothetical protein [Paenibacillus agricola]|uniref:Uncharacterized protein n=1 Tax=Paenibacillus agricola TaxID=2716264 RepID=A0ABX0JGB3_9BACL|nr:hypothetical protein [Paenibacillus agricola]NHN32876.1 hypothetical protein [Paenibacillus agricola]